MRWIALSSVALISTCFSATGSAQQVASRSLPLLGPGYQLAPQQAKFCQLNKELHNALATAKAPFGHEVNPRPIIQPYKEKFGAILGPRFSFQDWTGVLQVSIPNHAGDPVELTFSFKCSQEPYSPVFTMPQKSLRNIDDPLVQAIGNTPAHAVWGYYSGQLLPDDRNSIRCAAGRCGPDPFLADPLYSVNGGFVTSTTNVTLSAPVREGSIFP